MSSKSYIKQAEKNIIKRANALRDISKLFDALATFGYKYFANHNEDYFIGLEKMRSAAYNEFAKACMDMLVFAGHGSKDVEEFCQSEFKRLFNDKQRYVIMNFLQENGRMPGGWLSSEEQGFRKEAKEIIDSFDNEPFGE